MIATILQDLRYGTRLLRQSPTFALVAIGTLGLGIGAVVGIFTVVNAILLRPLPMRDPDRVGVINAQYLKTNTPARGAASWTKFQMVRDEATSFSEMGAYVNRDFTVDPGNGPARVRGARVTAGLFEVMGITPSVGRSFTPQDDAEGAAPVAIITDAFWRSRLNADPNIVSKTIRIEGLETPIVGVLPSGFQLHFSDTEPQVYVTRVFNPDVMTAVQIRSGAGFLVYVARLKPGVTFEQAQADLNALDKRYGQEHGGFVDATVFGLRIVPFAEELVGSIRPTLRILMGAVLFLLMIACANVAHLLLARAAIRRKEVAVRLAIGASYSRLIRQFLTEALLLAFGGCILGILVARLAVSALVAYGPANIPRLTDASPDVGVLAFAVAVAAITAIVFGVIPAFRTRSVGVGESLKTGSVRGITKKSGWVQQGIAVSETAVTVVLLIAAALLFRSLVRLQSVDPGFGTHNITTAQVTLQQSKYAADAQREAFFTDLLHEMQAQPGLTAVGATSYLPMAGPDYGFFFFIDGEPHLGVGRDPTINVRHVSPDFFRAMEIPVRRGRSFSERDTAQSVPVAIINEAAVRRYFQNRDPIGWHLADSRDGIMREIVGVVGDVRFTGPERCCPAELYLPYPQRTSPTMTVVVSSTLSTDAVAGAIRQSVRKLDPDQAVAEIRPMERVVAARTAQQQFTTSLLGTFASVATALAAIGLYGVVAVFVSQRRHEFGIRMALGAQRADVLRLVLRHGGGMILLGTAAGVIGAVAVSRILQSLLYGVTATEPLSYVIGAVVLLFTGLVACYVPARRATRVDPAQTLRAD